MKKNMMLLFCATVLALCASCGQNTSGAGELTPSVSSNSGLTDTSTPQSEADVDVSGNFDSEERADLSETGDGIGGDDFCVTHKFLFHSYETALINYVGEEKFKEWGETMAGQDSENSNIVSFVEYFNIPKETFVSITRGNLNEEFLQEFEGSLVYSLEMIDAIYSGDKKLINETFCGPLAFVNETDGELYSIYWLAEHSAEDYAAAGLSLEQVEEVLEAAASGDYGDQSQRIEAVEPALTQAYALEEAALAAEEEGLATDNPDPAESEESPAESTPADDEDAAE